MDDASRVQLYTKPLCTYCWRAKLLLRRRRIDYREIVIGDDPTRRAWLAEVTGQQTLPQVFIDERSVGGFRELLALDRSGELGRILRGQG